ncbi:helix-turn-helix domain-containing protein [Gordonia amarae]|nr:helix-turn-helix domain-containing protein [Gordonia amarae]MCS3879295.1 excisionase family DNA binding protein [Gordonia amarae]QHN17787.1 helix-turn-helix domain-containing protein [Gordonia amarae]QHN22318.1 helix-turn-helix domain-containing protein [Gordonia amarae]QHN31194.1 helix-turn-helix domain-containing protein [Gordonia amarae]QHN39939.1 helix-turn-helix domain-containing protein [Gordonia amarae]
MKNALRVDPATMSPNTWNEIRDYFAAAEAAGEVVEITSRLELLTPAQAADHLGVSRSTIARRIDSGDIHAIKVGAHHRIPLKEFERFRDARSMAKLIRATSEEIEADLYGE